MVGTSGAETERLPELMARARSFPAVTWVSSGGSAPKRISTLLPSTAVVAGALPLNGMCAMSSPAFAAKVAITRWVVVACPAEP